MQNYKIAIIGLGSIGKRHLLNVSHYLSERNIFYTIDLIRSNNNKDICAELKKYVQNIYYFYEDVNDNYDVIFITCPTYLHYETVKKYTSKTKHMFIEKPVFDDANKCLSGLNLKDDGIYYVACPLRYTDVIQYIKNEIDFNKVYSVRAISSSYLPEWRPNVDYRKTYSAHAEQGGGVTTDLIHEWDYIYYLFGKPEKVYNLKGKFSNLHIDTDDLSIYIVKYNKMMVEVHLDYFGRKTIRELQLFTDNDTIVADISNSEIRYLRDGKIISFNETRNNFHQKEIEYFFDIIEGKAENHNDINTAVKILKIAKEGYV